MKITEKVIDNPEKKGEAILGYTAQKECIPVRMEDILYYEIKNKLYQIEEKLTRKCMQRASKTMILNADHIVSVRTALNGRLYVRMENAGEILVTRKYAKEITGYLMETN